MELNKFQDSDSFDTIDLKRFFSLLRRNMWLLLIALLLGAIAAFVFSFFQTPIYSASTQVMVVQSNFQGNSVDVTQSLDVWTLAQTYSELLSQDWILDKVSEHMGDGMSIGLVEISLSKNYAPLFYIDVEDADPKRASLIANTLVEVLIEQNESIQSARFTKAEENLDLQIAQIEKQLAQTQTNLELAKRDAFTTQVTETQNKIQNTQSVIETARAELSQLEGIAATEVDPGVTNKAIKEKQEFLALQNTLLNTYQDALTNLQTSGKISTDTNEIIALQNNLTLYQQIYLGLLDNRETIRLNRIQNMPNVVQANPAIATEFPVRPRKVLNTLIGGFAGLLIALSIVLIKEFLDTTIKSRDDVEKTIGLPVLGYSLPLVVNEEEDGPFVLNSPRAPAAEAFRSLRTNLEFIGVDKPIKTLLVSSSEASEGKTITVANLAVIMAQGGKKVVIVDADLRRPRLHQEMGVPNRLGLSDIFRGRILEDVLLPYRDLSLSVITSGSIPPNPAELLGSEKMKHILDELALKFDIVLIDSSPTLVTDSQLIAARVDGVLLVVRAGESQAEAARATVEQYRRVNARLLGVVLNNVTLDNQYGYSNYYYRNDDENLPANRSKLKLLFSRLPWNRKKMGT